MEKENKNTIEIDIRRIFMALWSRAWIIILVTVVLSALAFGYARLFVTPTYTASIQVYVNNSSSKTNSEIVSNSQIVAAQNLAYTYMVIIDSRSVLSDVAKQTGLKYSYGQLKSMIYSEAVSGTEIFKVTVTSTNYKHSAIIANAIADVLPEKIAAIVDGSSVRIVDRAVENPNPVGPNYTRYAMLGSAAGLLLSMALIVILDLLDTTIVSEDYLTHVYSRRPLLAVIPGTENPKTGYYKGYYESYGVAHHRHNQRTGEKKTGGETK